MTTLFSFDAIVIIPTATDTTEATKWFSKNFGAICMPNMMSITSGAGDILVFTAESRQAMSRTLINEFIAQMKKVGVVTLIRYHTYLSGNAPLTSSQATLGKPDKSDWHAPTGNSLRP